MLLYQCTRGDYPLGLRRLSDAGNAIISSLFRQFSPPAGVGSPEFLPDRTLSHPALLPLLGTGIIVPGPWDYRGAARAEWLPILRGRSPARPGTPRGKNGRACAWVMGSDRVRHRFSRRRGGDRSTFSRCLPAITGECRPELPTTAAIDDHHTRTVMPDAITGPGSPTIPVQQNRSSLS